MNGFTFDLQRFTDQTKTIGSYTYTYDDSKVTLNDDGKTFVYKAEDATVTAKKGETTIATYTLTSTGNHIVVNDANTVLVGAPGVKLTVGEKTCEFGTGSGGCPIVFENDALKRITIVTGATLTFDNTVYTNETATGEGDRNVHLFFEDNAVNLINLSGVKDSSLKAGDRTYSKTVDAAANIQIGTDGSLAAINPGITVTIKDGETYAFTGATDSNGSMTFEGDGNVRRIGLNQGATLTATGDHAGTYASTGTANVSVCFDKEYQSTADHYFALAAGAKIEVGTDENKKVYSCTGTVTGDNAQYIGITEVDFKNDAVVGIYFLKNRATKGATFTDESDASNKVTYTYNGESNPSADVGITINNKTGEVTLPTGVTATGLQKITTLDGTTKNYLTSQQAQAAIADAVAKFTLEGLSQSPGDVLNVEYNSNSASDNLTHGFTITKGTDTSTHYAFVQKTVTNTDNTLTTTVDLVALTPKTEGGTTTYELPTATEANTTYTALSTSPITVDATKASDTKSPYVAVTLSNDVLDRNYSVEVKKGDGDTNDYILKLAEGIKQSEISDLKWTYDESTKKYTGSYQNVSAGWVALDTNTLTYQSGINSSREKTITLEGVGTGLFTTTNGTKLNSDVAEIRGTNIFIKSSTNLIDTSANSLGVSTGTNFYVARDAQSATMPEAWSKVEADATAGTEAGFAYKAEYKTAGLTGTNSRTITNIAEDEKPPTIFTLTGFTVPEGKTVGDYFEVTGTSTTKTVEVKASALPTFTTETDTVTKFKLAAGENYNVKFGALPTKFDGKTIPTEAAVKEAATCVAGTDANTGKYTYKTATYDAYYQRADDTTIKCYSPTSAVEYTLEGLKTGIGTKQEADATADTQAVEGDGSWANLITVTTVAGTGEAAKPNLNFELQAGALDQKDIKISLADSSNTNYGAPTVSLFTGIADASTEIPEAVTAAATSSDGTTFSTTLNYTASGYQAGYLDMSKNKVTEKPTAPAEDASAEQKAKYETDLENYNAYNTGLKTDGHTTGAQIYYVGQRGGDQFQITGLNTTTINAVNAATSAADKVDALKTAGVVIGTEASNKVTITVSNSALTGATEDLILTNVAVAEGTKIEDTATTFDLALDNTEDGKVTTLEAVTVSEVTGDTADAYATAYKKAFDKAVNSALYEDESGLTTPAELKEATSEGTTGTDAGSNADATTAKSANYTYTSTFNNAFYTKLADYDSANSTKVSKLVDDGYMAAEGTVQFKRYGKGDAIPETTFTIQGLKTGLDTNSLAEVREGTSTSTAAVTVDYKNKKVTLSKAALPAPTDGYNPLEDPKFATVRLSGDDASTFTGGIELADGVTKGGETIAYTWTEQTDNTGTYTFTIKGTTAGWVTDEKTGETIWVKQTGGQQFTISGLQSGLKAKDADDKDVSDANTEIAKLPIKYSVDAEGKYTFYLDDSVVIDAKTESEKTAFEALTDQSKITIEYKGLVTSSTTAGQLDSSITTGYTPKYTLDIDGSKDPVTLAGSTEAVTVAGITFGSVTAAHWASVEAGDPKVNGFTYISEESAYKWVDGTTHTGGDSSITTVKFQPKTGGKDQFSIFGLSATTDINGISAATTFEAATSAGGGSIVTVAESVLGADNGPLNVATYAETPAYTFKFGGLSSYYESTHTVDAALVQDTQNTTLYNFTTEHTPAQYTIGTSTLNVESATVQSYTYQGFENHYGFTVGGLSIQGGASAVSGKTEIDKYFTFSIAKSGTDEASVGTVQFTKQGLSGLTVGGQSIVITNLDANGDNSAPQSGQSEKADFTLKVAVASGINTEEGRVQTGADAVLSTLEGGSTVAGYNYSYKSAAYDAWYNVGTSSILYNASIAAADQFSLTGMKEGLEAGHITFGGASGANVVLKKDSVGAYNASITDTNQDSATDGGNYVFELYTANSETYKKDREKSIAEADNVTAAKAALDSATSEADSASAQSAYEAATLEASNAFDKSQENFVVNTDKTYHIATFNTTVEAGKTGDFSLKSGSVDENWQINSASTSVTYDGGTGADVFSLTIKNLVNPEHGVIVKDNNKRDGETAYNTHTGGISIFAGKVEAAGSTVQGDQLLNIAYAAAEDDTTTKDVDESKDLTKGKYTITLYNGALPTSDTNVTVSVADLKQGTTTVATPNVEFAFAAGSQSATYIQNTAMSAAKGTYGFTKAYFKEAGYYFAADASDTVDGFDQSKVVYTSKGTEESFTITGLRDGLLFDKAGGSAWYFDANKNASIDSEDKVALAFDTSTSVVSITKYAVDTSSLAADAQINFKSTKADTENKTAIFTLQAATLDSSDKFFIASDGTAPTGEAALAKFGKDGKEITAGSASAVASMVYDTSHVPAYFKAGTAEQGYDTTYKFTPEAAHNSITFKGLNGSLSLANFGTTDSDSAKAVYISGTNITLSKDAMPTGGASDSTISITSFSSIGADGKSTPVNDYKLALGSDVQTSKQYTTGGAPTMTADNSGKYTFSGPAYAEWYQLGSDQKTVNVHASVAATANTFSISGLASTANLSYASVSGDTISFGSNKENLYLSVNEKASVVTVLNKNILPTTEGATVTFASAMNAGGTSAYYTFDFSNTGVLSEKKGTEAGTLTIDGNELLYNDKIDHFAYMEAGTTTNGTTTYTYHTESNVDWLYISNLKTPTATDQTPESLAKLIGTEYIVDYDKKTVTIGAGLLYTPKEFEEQFKNDFDDGKVVFQKQTNKSGEFADYTISFADSLDASMQALSHSAAFATVSGEENSFNYTAAETTAGYSNDDDAKTIVYSQKVGGEPFKITGIRDLTNVTPTVSADGTTTFAETVEGAESPKTYLTVQKDGTVTLYKGALLDTPTPITFTDTDTKDSVDYKLVFDSSTTDSIATVATTDNGSINVESGTLTYTTKKTPLYYTNDGSTTYTYHEATGGKEIKITGMNNALTSVTSAEIEFTEGTASGGTTPVIVTVKSKDILGKGNVEIKDSETGYSATFNLTADVTTPNASAPAALTYDSTTAKTTYTAAIGGGNAYAADSNGKKLTYTAMQGGETFIVEGVKQNAILGTDVKVGTATGEGTLKTVPVTLEASALSAAKDIVFADTAGDSILYTLTLGEGIVTTDTDKRPETITSGTPFDTTTTVSSTLKYESAYSPKYYESVSTADETTKYTYHAEVPSTSFTIANLKAMTAAEIGGLSIGKDIVITAPTTVTTEDHITGDISTKTVPGSIKLGANVLPVSLDSSKTIAVTSDTLDTYKDYKLGLMEDDATDKVTSHEIETTVTAGASSAYTFTSPGYGNGYSVNAAENDIVYKTQVGGEQFVLSGIKDLSGFTPTVSADGKTITYFEAGGTSTAPKTNYLAYNTDDGKVTLYADALDPGKNIIFTDLNSTLGTYDDVVYTLTLNGIDTAPSSVTPGYVSINGGNVYYNTKAAPAYYNNSASAVATTVAETGETRTTTTYDYIAPATSTVITVSSFGTGLANGTSTVAVDTTTGTIAGYAGLKITESIPTDDITPVKFEISDPKYLNTVNVVANVGENTLYSAAVAVGGTSIATEVAAIEDAWTALNSGKSTYVIDAKEAYYQVGSNSTASVLTYVPSVTGTDALELAGIDIAAWGTNGASAPTIQDGVVTFGYNVGGTGAVSVTSNVGYIAAAEKPEGGEGGTGTSNPAEAEVTRTPYSFKIDAAGMKFVGTKNADTITVSAAASVDAGEGNDLITVSGANAYVDAGAGADSINATVTSTVLAGEGNDLITVSGLSAFVDAGAGDDLINVSGANAYVDAGAGADSINATAAATVNAGEGDDFITIAGAASVDGGKGNDTFKYEKGDAVVLLNGSSGKDTINYSANYKVSVGSETAPKAYLITNENDDDTTTYDVQIVYDNSNILFVKNVQTVESGIATINAVLSNGEAATITAGEVEKGAMFHYDNSNIAKATAVSLNTSAIADKFNGAIPFAGSKVTPTDYEDNPEKPTIKNISAAGIEIAGLAIQGNNLDNVIIGGNQGNSIDGGKGNDSIRGGNGPDTLIGGKGNDTLAGGTLEGDDADTFVYSDGLDVITDFQSGETIKLVASLEEETTEGGDAGNSDDPEDGTEGGTEGGGDDKRKITGTTISGNNITFDVDETGKAITLNNVFSNKVSVATVNFVDESGNEITSYDYYKDGKIVDTEKGIASLTSAFTANEYKADASISTVYNGTTKAIKIDVSANETGATVIGNDKGGTIVTGEGDDSYVGSESVAADLFVYTAGEDSFENFDAKDAVSLAGSLTIGSISGITVTAAKAADASTAAEDGTAIISFGGENGLTLKGAGINDSLKINNTTYFLDTDALMDKAADSATKITLTSARTDAYTTKSTVANTIDGSAVTGKVDITGNDKNNSISAAQGGGTVSVGGGNDTVKLYEVPATTGESAQPAEDKADVIVFNAGGNNALTIQNFGDKDSIKLVSGTGTITLDASAISTSIKGNDVIFTITDKATATGEGGATTTVDAAGGTISVIGGAKGGKAITFLNANNESISTGKYDADGIVSDDGKSITLSAAVKNPYEAKDNIINVNAKDASNVVTLTANASASVGGSLVGNAKNNVINAGKNGDSLYGEAGADTLNGSVGADYLIGGAGNDVFVVGQGADTIADYNTNEKNENDKIQLAGLSTFTNIAFDGDNNVNVILSDSKNNSVKILNGADKAISFTDGKNTETFVYSSYGTFNKDKTAVTLASNTSTGFDPNTITTGEGENTQLAYPNLKEINSSLVGTSVEIKAISSIGSNLSNEGSDTAMTLTGSTGNDVFTGGKGNDTLKGNGGSDIMTGGDGNDTFVFTAGNKNDKLTIKDFATGDGISIEGAASAKASVTNKGHVIFTAYNDKDSVVGSVVVEGVAEKPSGTLKAEETTINLTVGSSNTSSYTYAYDKISSSDGKEVTLTSAFDSKITAVTLGADNFANVTKLDAEATTNLASITASNSGNTIVGNAKNNFIIGGDGNDFFDGGDGKDNLTGGAGNDTLLGGAGDDILDGGAGDDSLTGGKGNDTFIISGGTDTITDYGDGKDNVSLDAGFGFTMASISGVTFAADTITSDSGTVTLDSGTYTLGFKGNDSSGAEKTGTLALHVEDKADAVTIMDSDNPKKAQAYKFVNGGVAIGRSITLLGAQNDAVTLGSGDFSNYNSLTANVTATVTTGNNGGNVTLNGGGSATGGKGKDVLAATAGGTLTGNAGNDTFVYDGGDVTVTDYGDGKDNVSLGAGWTITNVESVSGGEGYKLTMSNDSVTGNNTNTLTLNGISDTTQVALTTTTATTTKNKKGDYTTKYKATKSNVYFGDDRDGIGGYISDKAKITEAKTITVASDKAADFSAIVNKSGQETTEGAAKNKSVYSKLVSITSASNNATITGNDKNNTIVLTGGGNGSVRGGLGKDTYVIGGAATVDHFGIGATAVYDSSLNETGTVKLASKITSATTTKKVGKGAAATTVTTAYAYDTMDYDHNAQGKDVLKVDGKVTAIALSDITTSNDKKNPSDKGTFSVTITVDADGKDTTPNDTYTVVLDNIMRQQKVTTTGKGDNKVYSGGNANADLTDLKAITIWDTSTGKSKKLTWKQDKNTGTVTLSNGAKGALANTVTVNGGNSSGSNVPTEDLVNDFVSGNDDLGDLMNGSSVGDVGNGLSNSDGTFGSNTTGDAAFTSGSSNNNSNKH